MNFYYVWVRSNRYHGSEPLTYASIDQLGIGSIIEVELQKEVVLGFISGRATKPRFATKTIRQTLNVPPLPLNSVRLASWMKVYYASSIGTVTQQFLPAQLPAKILLSESITFPAPDLSHLPLLTKEQSKALNLIQESNTFVLHGNTGTGKTRLYIELAAQSIASGKSAIILTPEISLTSQLAYSFREVFKDRVILTHSQQTPQERRSAWLQSLRADQPIISIGPRSALFSPIPKLGLIVIDEAHEAAYKQDQMPQYQTGRVAGYLNQIARGKLVLGSATPSVADYYLAEQRRKPIIRLKHLARATDHLVTKVDIIDLKDRSQFSKSSLLSQPLILAVKTALQRGEQSLLYLNRRGTARLILCENCGWQANCPHCDLPLTYHGDDHQLRCHSCDYHIDSLSSCPVCDHPSIIFRTPGTKAILEEAQKLFPDARIARFDTDNKKAERFEQHYEAVRRGEIDILVGTQLLAKGLDLERLSTLGIILADTSLYIPDFSAQERTFELITQVLGRIGRGHTNGRALIQTYHPDHPILKQAIKQDYDSFYNTEMKSRKQYFFPPFCFMLKVTFRRASSASAEKAAVAMSNTLRMSLKSILVEGPAPAFHERFQNKFQWQLVIKSLQRSDLLQVVKLLPANCSFDLDPIDLL